MKDMLQNFWMWLFVFSVKKMGFAIVVPYPVFVEGEEIYPVIHIADNEEILLESMEIFLTDYKRYSEDDKIYKPGIDFDEMQEDECDCCNKGEHNAS